MNFFKISDLQFLVKNHYIKKKNKTLIYGTNPFENFIRILMYFRKTAYNSLMGYIIVLCYPFEDEDYAGSDDVTYRVLTARSSCQHFLCMVLFSSRNTSVR